MTSNFKSIAALGLLLLSSGLISCKNQKSSNQTECQQLRSFLITFENQQKQVQADADNYEITNKLLGGPGDDFIMQRYRMMIDSLSTKKRQIRRDLAANCGGE
jgi:hypothetical protein